MNNTSATGGPIAPAGAPLTSTDLEDLFADLFAGVTGLDPTLIRPRWQTVVPKQPAPGVNWMAFGITDTKPDAGPVLQHDGAAVGGLGVDNYARHADITLLASFYGPGGEMYATQVQDSMAVPQNLEFLRPNLITYVNSGTIRNVPEKVNEQWIRRWDMVLNFRRKTERTYPVENILTADFSITTS